jgi:transglutaminase-like putative cysteine protease
MCLSIILSGRAIALSADSDQSIDLDKPLVLQLTKASRVEAVLRAKSPPTPAGLFVYFPYPPTTRYQTDVTAALTRVEAGNLSSATVITDFSPLHRRVFQIQPSDKNEFDIEARFTFQMWKRRLINRDLADSVEVITPLTPSERQFYTSPSRSHPFNDAAFGAWLKQEGLVRQENETPVRFAHRALLYMSHHMQYSLARPLGKTLAENARLGKGECNLISAVYGTIMRANGVPCRRVSGRRISNGATHNKVEIFIENVGWIPVEPTGAIGSHRDDKMDCFGVDDGTFFVCMEDSDLIIPAGNIRNWLGVLSQFYLVQSGKPGYSLQDDWKVMQTR